MPAEPISPLHVGRRVILIGPQGRGRWQGRITAPVGNNLAAAHLITDAGRRVALLVRYWRVAEILPD